MTTKQQTAEGIRARLRSASEAAYGAYESYQLSPLSGDSNTIRALIEAVQQLGGIVASLQKEIEDLQGVQ